MRVLSFCSLIFLMSGITVGLTSCGGGSSSDSSSPDIRHRIFVTNTIYSGNLGGLVGADIICTNVAAAAGIVGSYQAVLSSSTEAANDRLVISGEVYLKGTGGEITVATSSAAFWNNNLAVPINVDENETTLVAMQGPWTGTIPGGGAHAIGLTCLDWVDGTIGSLGATGDTSTTTSSQWVNANGFTCDEMRPLYCIEE